MLGLMQQDELTVDKLLGHAARWHATTSVLSREANGTCFRSDYSGVHSLAKQVSRALQRAGISRGDRVATLGWNSVRHFAAWYGATNMGAILHTLNPRLHIDQIAYIANHANDLILLADPACTEIVAQLLLRVPSIKRVVFLTDASSMPETEFAASAFDDWIADEPSEYPWGGFDENIACGLCYTSGTTGNPKGVLYSHRSNYIHALTALQPDALALSARDTVLLLVPMYHANAWGMVYAAPAVGAKLVLPGTQMDGESVCDLIEREGVTFAIAVPTIWQGLLQYLKASGRGLHKLQRVVIGGSALPEMLVRAFRDDYGIEVRQGWGMTETSPIATVSTPDAAVAAADDDTQVAYALKQGRLMCGMDLKLSDDDGNAIPFNGRTPGRLGIKGLTVVSRYFGSEAGEAVDEDGFFDTGDVATIDPRGYVQITDRAKDVIKSGGEWISSIEIENIAVGHSAVALAAVIGVPHPKWDERPILLCQLKPGETASKDEITKFLAGKIAKWWMPDDVLFVEEIPLGATGKVDKKLLRKRINDYALYVAG